MSWASKRTTTRDEDMAYSLLGLFRVYMPMLYGEGKNAFRRLQLEILRVTNDHSIFAWNAIFPTANVLANDPTVFESCSDIVRMDFNEYWETIKQLIPKDEFDLISEEQLRTCSVTNGGIQVWLPIRQDHDSLDYRAFLACHQYHIQEPVSIMLTLFKSQYHRSIKPFLPLCGPVHFRQLYLSYDEVYHSDVTFKLEDSILSMDGFVKQSNFAFRSWSILTPEILGEAVYSNQTTDTEFCISMGSFARHPWVHLAPWGSRYFPGKLDIPEQAQAIATSGRAAKKHIHLLKTCLAIRLTYQRLPEPNTHLLILDVAKCIGHFCSNDTWQAFDSIPVVNSDMFSHVRSVMADVIENTLLVDDVPLEFVQMK